MYQFNDIIITKNFKLSEFVRTKHYNFNEENKEVAIRYITDIIKLTTTILQPLRDYIGRPLHITSGVRCKELNKLVGGSERSQHCVGQAVDITVTGWDLELTFNDIVDFLKKNKIKFGQCIYEFKSATNSEWIHISTGDKYEIKKLDI